MGGYSRTASCTLALFVAATGTARAAEGFKVRYPVAGVLGPELTVFEPAPGTIVSTAATAVDLTALNGADGRPAWTPPVTSPAGVTQSGRLDFKQHQAMIQAFVGHVVALKAHADFLVLGLNVPYALSVHRSLRFPVVRATLPNGAPTAPGPAFVAGLAAQARANDVTTGGFGDADVSATWVHVADRWKLGAGVAVGLPDGDFHSQASGAPGTPPINIGNGRFYTFRPTATVSWQAADRITLGARAALGLNTVDSVDHWRSGDFRALELAAVYRSPAGAFGLQGVAVRQFQDDTGGQAGTQPGGYGANRYRTTGAGAFYALRVGELGVNIGYTAQFRAVNAFAGHVFQLRLSQQF